jgi:hypothetical protein
MTVIGGLFTEHVQLILSDNLLSTKLSTGLEMQTLPMWRGGVLPSELNAARLVQKLHLFNRRNALCWSGSPITASTLITTLQSIFDKVEFPDPAIIMAVINQYRNCDATFIFTAIVKDEVLILTSDKVVHQTYRGLGTICADGSGRDDLLYFLSADRFGSYSENGYQEHNEVMRQYLVASHLEAKLGAIMFNGADELRNRWGGGSEIALRIGDEFVKLSGAVYAYHSLLQDKIGNLVMQSYGGITTKEYIDNDLIICDFDLSNGMIKNFKIPPLVENNTLRGQDINNLIKPDSGYMSALNIIFVTVPGPLNGTILIAIEKADHALDIIEKLSAGDSTLQDIKTMQKESNSRLLRMAKGSYKQALRRYSKL